MNKHQNNISQHCLMLNDSIWLKLKVKAKEERISISVLIENILKKELESNKDEQ
tara:strand:- start:468 stop:629 length:162 start_codon:yes stop_codon:yes gene_type:complete